jgi:hypothetical protein
MERADFENDEADDDDDDKKKNNNHRLPINHGGIIVRRTRLVSMYRIVLYCTVLYCIVLVSYACWHVYCTSLV